MPAETRATATAPTVNAPARERFRGADNWGGSAGGVAGVPGLPGERAVRLPVLRLLSLPPLVALRVGLLLPVAGMACGSHADRTPDGIRVAAAVANTSGDSSCRWCSFLWSWCGRTDPDSNWITTLPAWSVIRLR